MSLYLVRHGQTEFNLARRYQGGLDSPLTGLGRRQAGQMGALLATLVPAGTPLVCSPLGRARHTAEIIAAAASLAAPTLDSRLAEVSLGVWDGLTDEDIDFAFPGARNGTSRWDWHFASPDGERYDGMAARLGAWLAEATATDMPLVAVSHGVAGRVIRGLYAGLAKDEALKLDVPQDAVFRLSEGRIERIDCLPLETDANQR
ncbi:MAG: histidine phosphatase family protein [Caulobacter sp.]|nr:histidine phosphatase family protein [Caulobacter sp.]